VSIEALNHVSKLAIMPSGRKFVAIALANYADENGSCFPSVEKLAQWTSQGEKTVRRHLDDLETEGFLTRERVRREDGTLGVYRFVLQRSFSPEAKLASGQIFHQPPAKMATHNHQSYPSTKNNNTRGSRLPVDWQPSQAEINFALDTGWTREHVEIEVNKFRDYWISKAGANACKVNWTATWRNWVRNNLQSNSRPPPHKQETYAEIGNRLLREMRNERSEIESDHRVIDLFPASGGRS
jgi:hypothetical protein